MILAAVAVLLGAATQRIAGLGFAMMVAPFVVIAFGAHQGVVLVNLMSAIAAALTWWAVRADVGWPAFARLTVTSVLGVVVGTLVASRVPGPSLQVALGSVLAVAVAASVLVARSTLHLTGRRWQLLTGGVTGVLVASAGIGGPPMSIYAVLSRWDHRSFVATMQPYQATLSSVAVLVAASTTSSSWPVLSPATWCVLAAAMVAGLAGGRVLARRVSHSAGRVVVILLAAIRAVATVANGALSL